MTQTTGQITGADNVVQMSTDGTNWTDYSGSANSVEPSGGERKKGGTHTFTGDTPIVSVGKRAEVSVKLRIIYTETAGEIAEALVNYYEDKTPVYLRYRPKGSLATYWQFTGGPGYITTMVAPKLEADNGNPVTVDCTWFGPSLAQSAQT